MPQLSLAGMRVLIVEDEEGLVSALRVGLQREGYAVDAALTEAEATDRLAVNEYDVALIDVDLPDGDGCDLARRLRAGEIECQAGRELRIVMLTALGTLTRPGSRIGCRRRRLCRQTVRLRRADRTAARCTAARSARRVLGAAGR